MKRNNKKEMAKNVILSGIILVLFSICVIQLNVGDDTINNVVTSVTGDCKIEWGLKRNNNHERPDMGEKNKQILENNGGICLGKELEKKVYLTFDSGYEAGFIGNILDVLKQNNVKATFFITSHYLNTASELVERMINEGHIIGNHIPNNSMYHFYISIINRDIERLG